MKVEIVSTQTIRPSSPTTTSDHLLSIFDQLTPPIYVPLIFFYTNTGDISLQEASDRLKQSLSVTLSSFSPLAAGSAIKNNTSFDCTDNGVNYREARVSCNLRDVLSPPDMEALGLLLPTACGYSTEAEGSGGFLLVQQSVFECGGIAVGICFSHKIADAATISRFVKSWAAACACGRDVVAAAATDFTLGSLFPAMDIFAWSTYPSHHLAGQAQVKCSSRRFAFSGPKMAALKAKSCSTSVPNPTRVEAVSSLIWQCTMRASLLSNTSTGSSYGLLQAVNLRKRINPPMPDTSFGNLVGSYVSKVDSDDPTDLPFLATKMRDAKEEYMQGFPTKLRGPEGPGLICARIQQAGAESGKVGLTMYRLTSWCRFGLYEADFGWGKPIWTSLSQFHGNNTIAFLDERDGQGIEAWLSLPEDVMLLLEQDQEFLSFASPNPNVNVTDL